MNYLYRIQNSIDTAKRDVLKSMKDYNKKNMIIQEGEVPDDETAMKIISIIQEKYKLPSVKLTPSGWGVGEELGTFFYGYPRYVDGDIPTDSSGKQLRFMAQVNCGILNSLQDFPHNGLLQFWVQGDEYHNFLDIKDPKAYQVIYIENPSNNNISNVEIDERVYTLMNAGDFPYIWKKDYNFSDNLLLIPSNEILTPNRTDMELYSKLVAIEFANMFGSKDIDPQLSRKITDIIFDDKAKNAWGNRVGGYPSFTQSGPAFRREPDDDSVLLLQLDSDKELNWGDSGIASFFISQKDLLHKNFNNIEFYWDCY